MIDRLKLKKAYMDMEQGTVPRESLEIKLTLKKNPEEYDKNTVQRMVGLAQNARQGDTISYYKSNTKGGELQILTSEFKEY